jgi:hydrogenase maturation protein HypF
MIAPNCLISPKVQFKLNMAFNKEARLIRIQGLVQGVGFRPFVYRMAQKWNIVGWVENNNEGVSIHAEALQSSLAGFIDNLRLLAPAASQITVMEVFNTESVGYHEFVIQKSSDNSSSITDVSPDIAVCADCLHDMTTQNHRIDYPFTNCTNCGPRFTIIKALPYDRHLTSMKHFAMCTICQAEYDDVLNRRFHAQPVACLRCGPAYFKLPDGELINNGQIVSRLIAEKINSGQVVALKGMGGYHLLCDAHNENAVKQLRARKNRDGKPMAVMVDSIETAHDYFHISESEAEALLSWRRPIVLLSNKNALAPSVSNGLHTTGIVLPYMPLHHQLFNHLKTRAVVLTSGNISDEPVIIDDAVAHEKLGKIADLLIGYNRPIHNRADDSVVFVTGGESRLIRRSRGFAPAPVRLGLNVEGIFAAGAELNNTFAMGKGNQLIMSQHIGDLKNAETLAFYEESYHRFCKLFRFSPQLIACDSHPDYLSSQFARSLGIETIEIQHHHAHIASCMAEHGLDEKVIGIAFDGTGYGIDGAIWGSEFMVCDLIDFELKFHFDPVPLPGGDHVTKQPWRTALSYLYKYAGTLITEINIPLLKQIPTDQYQIITQMIDKGLNCPLSSGAGRLFDAVAALTGLCYESSYHAEAPMLLEAAIKKNCRGKYLFELVDGNIVFRKMFHQLIRDIQGGTPVEEMSAKFHNTIISALLTVVRKINHETGIDKVVLSGGTFQNRYLLELAENMLAVAGFKVYTQRSVPSNDGGIALGQMAIAAKRISQGLHPKPMIG